HLRASGLPLAVYLAVRVGDREVVAFQSRARSRLRALLLCAGQVAARAVRAARLYGRTGVCAWCGGFHGGRLPARGDRDASHDADPRGSQDRLPGRADTGTPERSRHTLDAPVRRARDWLLLGLDARARRSSPARI